MEEHGSKRVTKSSYKENATWIAAKMPGALTETGMHKGFSLHKKIKEKG